MRVRLLMRSAVLGLIGLAMAGCEGDWRTSPVLQEDGPAAASAKLLPGEDQGKTPEMATVTITMGELKAMHAKDKRDG